MDIRQLFWLLCGYCYDIMYRSSIWLNLFHLGMCQMSSQVVNIEWKSQTFDWRKKQPKSEQSKSKQPKSKQPKSEKPTFPQNHCELHGAMFLGKVSENFTNAPKWGSFRRHTPNSACFWWLAYTADSVPQLTLERITVRATTCKEPAKSKGPLWKSFWTLRQLHACWRQTSCTHTKASGTRDNKEQTLFGWFEEVALLGSSTSDLNRATWTNHLQAASTKSMCTPVSYFKMRINLAFFSSIWAEDNAPRKKM